MSLYITQQFTKNNYYYNHDTGSLNPKGIILHSTSEAGVDAASWFNIYNGTSHSTEGNASTHGFLDIDGKLIQTLPFEQLAHHIYINDGNSNYIGIEMCESSYIHYDDNNDPKHNSPIADNLT